MNAMVIEPEAMIRPGDAAAASAAPPALPPVVAIAGLADLFAALADPTRLRLIAALAPGELSVGQLAATIALSHSAVSHQLQLLRRLGLVRPRRDGRQVYYELDDDHVLALYRQGLDHVAHGRGGHHSPGGIA
jgi:DNA-binding transcriptional ArsR family regulator